MPKLYTKKVVSFCAFIFGISKKKGERYKKNIDNHKRVVIYNGVATLQVVGKCKGEIGWGNVREKTAEKNVGRTGWRTCFKYP